MSTLTASLLAILISVPVAPEGLRTGGMGQEIAIEHWQPEVGDKVVVDTKHNEAYIIHPNGSYLNFPVVTGQRRWVYYIGRSYNASTPNWNWEAKTLHQKGDKVTFGPSGRFLRLYKDGDTHTAYGFHEYRTDEEMFGEDNEYAASERFKSMGCVVVKAAMMDLIVETWEINSGNIEVVTQYGVDDIKAKILAMQ